VPETATLLFNSGFTFPELGEDQQMNFQEDLLKTLLQIENTITDTAKYFYEKQNSKCLVIYDRGAMDPVACMCVDFAYCQMLKNSAYLKLMAFLFEDMAKGHWETVKQRNQNWNDVELRDDRYDQIIHLVTAANGAEEFYTLENNAVRKEGLDLARELDEKLAQIWVGHPYIDVIDNSTDFEKKLSRVIQVLYANLKF
jgi:hypothetical protein